MGDVQAELGSYIYYRTAKEERASYEHSQLTESAANAFPAVQEMWNAGRCFALDQPIARVLHSMRALELVPECIGGCSQVSAQQPKMASRYQRV